MQPVENVSTTRFVTNTQSHTNGTGGAAQANNFAVDSSYPAYGTSSLLECTSKGDAA